MSSILNIIGNTPLIKLDKVSKELECEVWIKCEFINPAGSIKDRVALFMVQDAIKSGKLKAGIVEPTSGNTGIGLALVCAALKIPLTIVMPESMSLERRVTIKHFGAKLVLTKAELGMQGAIDKAEKIAKKSGYIMLDQFSNPSNPKAHYQTTAPEIYKAMPNIDIFIASIGTGGTVSGIGKFLKEQNSSIKVYGIEPSESAVINGKSKGAHKIEGIGAGFIPKNLDLDIVDLVLEVSSSEAINTAKNIAKEGLFVGISSGANVAAIYKLAKEVDIKGKKIVTILPDSASRYLSTELFN
jgi:cysteine synthase A